MSEYDDLLLDAYKGEVFGDAFFGALAEDQPDPDRADDRHVAVPAPGREQAGLGHRARECAEPVDLSGLRHLHRHRHPRNERHSDR